MIYQNIEKNLILKCDDCAERTVLTDENAFKDNPFAIGWKQYEIFLGRCECWSGSGRWSPHSFHRCKECRIKHELKRQRPDDYSIIHGTINPDTQRHICVCDECWDSREAERKRLREAKPEQTYLLR